jgi:hypothetical protein
MSIKMAAFWDVAPCNLVDIDRRFGGAYCPHHHDEAPSSSEMLVSYQITAVECPEDSHLQNYAT